MKRRDFVTFIGSAAAAQARTETRASCAGLRPVHVCEAIALSTCTSSEGGISIPNSGHTWLVARSGYYRVGNLEIFRDHPITIPAKIYQRQAGTCRRIGLDTGPRWLMRPVRFSPNAL
jgi:hypothetical protein